MAAHFGARSPSYSSVPRPLLAGAFGYADANARLADLYAKKYPHAHQPMISLDLSEWTSPPHAAAD